MVYGTYRFHEENLNEKNNINIFDGGIYLWNDDLSVCKNQGGQ